MDPSRHRGLRGASFGGIASTDKRTSEVKPGADFVRVHFTTKAICGTRLGSSFLLSTICIMCRDVQDSDTDKDAHYTELSCHAHPNNVQLMHQRLLMHELTCEDD